MLDFKSSLKILANMNMFWQHYLENKPNFLACIRE